MTREEFLQKLPSLAQDYQPSPEVFDKIAHITLLMVVGPSGAGKTSIIKRLNIPYVASDNTRPPRPEEIEGEDYHFRDDYQQLADDIRDRKFVQVAVDSGGDLKATRVDCYPSFGLAVCSVVADVLPIFRQLGFERTISVYIVPPSLQEWLRRMEAHKLGPDQLEKRMAEANRSLKFALSDQHMHFILNDSLDEAAAQIMSLIGGKRNSVREAFAKQTADKIYQELSAQ